MIINTKHLGEIELSEEKILTFEHGIFGFEECTRYALLYLEDQGSEISWLQSLDDVALALPVISPQLVMEDYNPIVDDDVLISLGEVKEDNMIILLTLTVPSDLTKMTTNLKAPVIVNVDTKKGCQVIVENSEYVVKYSVYDKFSKKEEEKGEITC